MEGLPKETSSKAMTENCVTPTKGNNALNHLWSPHNPESCKQLVTRLQTDLDDCMHFRECEEKLKQDEMRVQLEDAHRSITTLTLEKNKIEEELKRQCDVYATAKRDSELKVFRLSQELERKNLDIVNLNKVKNELANHEELTKSRLERRIESLTVALEEAQNRMSSCERIPEETAQDAELEALETKVEQLNDQIRSHQANEDALLNQLNDTKSQLTIQTCRADQYAALSAELIADFEDLSGTVSALINDFESWQITFAPPDLYETPLAITSEFDELNSLIKRSTPSFDFDFALPSTDDVSALISTIAESATPWKSEVNAMIALFKDNIDNMLAGQNEIDCLSNDLFSFVEALLVIRKSEAGLAVGSVSEIAVELKLLQVELDLVKAENIAMRSAVEALEKDKVLLSEEITESVKKATKLEDVLSEKCAILDKLQQELKEMSLVTLRAIPQADKSSTANSKTPENEFQETESPVIKMSQSMFETSNVQDESIHCDDVKHEPTIEASEVTSFMSANSSFRDQSALGLNINNVFTVPRSDEINDFAKYFAEYLITNQVFHPDDVPPRDSSVFHFLLDRYLDLVYAYDTARQEILAIDAQDNATKTLLSHLNSQLCDDSSIMNSTDGDVKVSLLNDIKDENISFSNTIVDDITHDPLQLTMDVMSTPLPRRILHDNTTPVQRVLNREPLSSVKKTVTFRSPLLCQRVNLDAENTRLKKLLDDKLEKCSDLEKLVESQSGELVKIQECVEELKLANENYLEELARVGQESALKIDDLLRKLEDSLDQNLQLRNQLFCEIIDLDPDLKEQLLLAPLTEVLAKFIELIMTRCQELQNSEKLEFEKHKEEWESEKLHLATSNQELKESVRNSNFELSNVTALLSGSNDEKAALEKRVSVLEEEAVKLKVEIVGLVKEREGLSQLLQSEKQDLEKEFSAMIIEKLSAAESEKLSLTASNLELAEKVRLLSSEVQNIEVLLANSNSEKATLEKLVSMLEDDIEILKEEKTALVLEIQNEKEELDQRFVAKEKLDAAELQNLLLTENNLDLAEKVRVLNNEIDNANVLLTQRNAEKAALEIQIEVESTKFKEEMDVVVEQLQKEKTELQQELLVARKEKVESATQSVDLADVLSEQKAMLEQRVNVLEAEIAKFQADIVVLSQEKDALMQQCEAEKTELEEKLSLTVKEAETKNQELEVLSGEKASLEQRVSVLQDETTKATQQFETEKTEWQDRLSFMINENLEAKTRFDSIEAVLKATAEEKSTLEQQLAALEEQTTKFKEEIDVLTQELQSEKGKIQQQLSIVVKESVAVSELVTSSNQEKDSVIEANTAKLNYEINVLIKERDSLIQQLEKERDSLAKIQEKSAAAESAKLQLEAKNAELTESIRLLDLELSCLKVRNSEENAELNRRITVLFEEGAKLTKERDSLVAENGRLRKNSATDLQFVLKITEKLNAAESEKEALSWKNAGLQGQVQLLTTDTENLTAYLRQSNEEKAELESKVSALKAEVAKLNELQQQQQQMEKQDKSEKVVKLEQQVANLEKSVAKLETELSDLNAEKLKLEAEFTDLENKHALQIGDLQLEINEKDDAKQNLEACLKEVGEKLAEAEKLLNAAEARNQDFTAELDLIRDELLNNKAVIERLNKEMNEVVLSRNAFKVRNEDLIKELGEASKIKEEILYARDLYKNSSLKLQAELDDMELKKFELEKVVDNYKSTEAAILRKLDEKQKADEVNTKLTLEVSELQNTIQANGSQILELKETNTRLTLEVSDLQKQIQAKVNQYLSEISELKDSNAKLSLEIADLRNQLQNKKAKLLDRISDLSQEVKTLSQDILDKQRTIDTAETKLRLTENALEKLTTDNQELQTNLTERRLSSDRTKTEVNEVNQRIENLQMKFTQKDGAISDLSVEVKELKDDNAEMLELLTQIQSALDLPKEALLNIRKSEDGKSYLRFFNDQNEKRNGALQDLEKKNLVYLDQHRRLTVEIENLRREKVEFELKTEELKAFGRSQDVQIESLHKKLACLETGMGRSRRSDIGARKLDKLEEINESLHSLFTEVLTTISMPNMQKINLLSVYDVNRARKAILDHAKAVAESFKSVQVITARMEELDAENQSLSDDIEKLLVENNKLELQVLKINDGKSESRDCESCKKLKTAKLEMEQLVANLKDEKDSLSRKLIELEETCKNLRLDLEAKGEELLRAACDTARSNELRLSSAAGNGLAKGDTEQQLRQLQKKCDMYKDILRTRSQTIKELEAKVMANKHTMHSNQMNSPIREQSYNLRSRNDVAAAYKKAIRLKASGIENL